MTGSRYLYTATVLGLLLLAGRVGAVEAEVEAEGALLLTGETFGDTINQLPSKNGMVMFYQEWCGHCKRLKPDWNRLAREASPSVYIASVDCGSHNALDDVDKDSFSSADLCKQKEVRNYPALKYYMNGDEHSYDGPRAFDSLMRFVEEELAVPCQVHIKESTCHAKAITYINKWQAKGLADIQKEIVRLGNMSASSFASMKPEQQRWIRERISLLKQLQDQNRSGQEL